jgi:Skp family chaperone for outer membrane proteins
MTRKLTITFLSVVAFTVGCKPAAEKTAGPVNVQAAQDKAKKETKEAEQAIKDYAYAQRAEFVEKMQSESAEINRELERLSAKIEGATDAAKTEAKPKLQALREKAAQLNKQLDEAKNATESTWDSIKSASKKSFEELKDSFQQSRQWLSEKIAP